MPVALRPVVFVAIALTLALGGYEKLQPARPAVEAPNAARERAYPRSTG